jgi:hypothetical protein
MDDLEGKHDWRRRRRPSRARASSLRRAGEITLRGRVWPIAGLREKLLAALRGGIKTVLIPEENAKDLVEISESIKKGLEIAIADNRLQLGSLGGAHDDVSSFVHPSDSHLRNSPQKHESAGKPSKESKCQI